MNLTEKEKEYILKNIPNAETLVEMDDQRALLIAIDGFINENGFAPPDYYEYNDIGREAQRIYDSIYSK